MPTPSFALPPAAGGRIHAYARVSTPDQAEADRTSLDEQERIIREDVARYRPGARIIVWTEEGVSGATPLAQRPTAKKCSRMCSQAKQSCARGSIACPAT